MFMILHWFLMGFSVSPTFFALPWLSLLKSFEPFGTSGHTTGTNPFWKLQIKLFGLACQGHKNSLLMYDRAETAPLAGMDEGARHPGGTTAVNTQTFDINKNGSTY